MTITRVVACSSILAMTLPTGSARQKEDAFQGVQQSIQERSGKTVRWKEDQAAHEQALQEVRQLLRKPLTVEAGYSPNKATRAIGVSPRGIRPKTLILLPLPRNPHRTSRRKGKFPHVIYRSPS
jgi:hypothetical protein